ncbi:MAG TPA: AraC family transcriptional regulator [Chitinophagaceae bacterium]|nr:AraC family transcriptional regulator [Chitinophagaceae bacterium]
MKEKRKIKLLVNEQGQLQSLMRQMEENPSGDYTIASLAKTLQINRHKLQYGFKTLTRYSIHQFVIKTRMGHAKKLLAETEKPIKEIAILCGYKSHEKFSHAFKKYFSYSPTHARLK